MKTITLAAFLAGIAVGASAVAPVLATILPTWGKGEVTPVVFVRYVGLDTFKPAAGAPEFSPTWRQSEVTPMVPTSYQGASDIFVPLHSDSSAVPGWKTDAIRPWVETTLDSFGNFVPRHAD